jgi:hypothetical protein
MQLAVSPHMSQHASALLTPATFLIVADVMVTFVSGVHVNEPSVDKNMENRGCISDWIAPRVRVRCVSPRSTAGPRKCVLRGRSE